MTTLLLATTLKPILLIRLLLLPPAHPASGLRRRRLFHQERNPALALKQRQAPINPYRCSGRGYGNSSATAARSIANARATTSTDDSSGCNCSRFSSNGNRFAPLQDANGSPVPLNGNTPSVSSKGDRVQFAEDQALANQLFGSGWTSAPSRNSKDSAATLAAS